MGSKDEELKRLERIVNKQKKIIQGFEGVSWFYSVVKRIPFVGRFFLFLAGILKSGRVSSFKTVDNVKSKNPEIIGICNPHPLNRGVQSSTYTLTSDVFEVSEIFSKEVAKKIARKITSYSPKKVIISGYALGYELLAEEIKALSPKIKIFAFIHSSFTWFGIDIYMAENPVFERMLALSKEGIIEKIGFCKRDLAEYFKKKGYPAYFVMNRFEIPDRKFKPLSKSQIKIGIFGHNWWHRNILNQVVAGLMVSNTEIHVNEIGDHEFLDEGRIVVHGFLSKEEFNKLYGEMDINLYVSFTDCFPMTLIESMENGIPCIASDTSDVYSWSPKLREYLVVSKVDGPLGISEKISGVIENYAEIQKEIKNYLPILKAEVEKSIKEFLT